MDTGAISVSSLGLHQAAKTAVKGLIKANKWGGEEAKSKEASLQELIYFPPPTQEGKDPVVTRKMLFDRACSGEEWFSMVTTAFKSVSEHLARIKIGITENMPSDFAEKTFKETEYDWMLGQADLWADAMIKESAKIDTEASVKNGADEAFLKTDPVASYRNATEQEKFPMIPSTIFNVARHHLSRTRTLSLLTGAMELSEHRIGRLRPLTAVAATTLGKTIISLRGSMTKLRKGRDDYTAVARKHRDNIRKLAQQAGMSEHDAFWLSCNPKETIQIAERSKTTEGFVEAVTSRDQSEALTATERSVTAQEAAEGSSGSLIHSSLDLGAMQTVPSVDRLLQD